MNSELLQLLAGVAGAFIGGLVFAWRTRHRMPQVLNSIVTTVTNALRSVVRDELESILDEKLKEPMRRLQTVEFKVARIEREAERRTGT